MNKILYVDDAPSMRKLVKMVLGSEFEVTLASNGQEALDASLEMQFDAVISDINMPIMDGLTFLGHFRSDEKHKFTPVLMMTTEASREMKDKGKELGATGWIVKPFDPAKLPSILHKLL